MKKKPLTPQTHYVSAKETIRLLGIKSQTLYAYVSRGWVRSIPGGKSSRERLYSKADIDRILTRQRARSGHGPAAASAMHWGEPILETSITEIAGETPSYRGREVIADLAEREVPFEQVAEWLWSGVAVEAPVRWQASPKQKKLWRTAFEAAIDFADGKTRISAFIAHLSFLEQREVDARPDQTLELCRSIYSCLSILISSPARFAEDQNRSIAHQLSSGWKLKDPSAPRLLNQALVVCADHELNNSTFVARVAASNGASSVLCIEAALAAHRGERQGLVSDGLENLLGECKSGRIGAKLESYFADHRVMPGFDHPLYPGGDPRAAYLLAQAREIGSKDPRFKALESIIAWMQEHYELKPNLDAGLVAASLALGLPPFSASTLFCFARLSGWIAHILEQRRQGLHIRPRARYVARLGL